MDWITFLIRKAVKGALAAAVAWLAFHMSDNGWIGVLAGAIYLALQDLVLAKVTGTDPTQT